MSEIADLFLGKLALKNSLISEEELHESLEIQEELNRQGVMKSLGQIMKENGLLGEKELSSLLKAQKISELLLENTLYGQLAIKNNLITRDQLKECLEEQRRNPHHGPIGQIMMDKGFLNIQQVQAIVKAQERLKKDF